ncbi:MAG: hypothetical protein PUH70_01285 [Clostridiales bacterium]|nr:hypothetical protein [Clostridiales bacterium]
MDMESPAFYAFKIGLIVGAAAAVYPICGRESFDGKDCKKQENPL